MPASFGPSKLGGMNHKTPQHTATTPTPSIERAVNEPTQPSTSTFDLSTISLVRAETLYAKGISPDNESTIEIKLSLPTRHPFNFKVTPQATTTEVVNFVTMSIGIVPHIIHELHMTDNGLSASQEADTREFCRIIQSDLHDNATLVAHSYEASTQKHTQHKTGADAEEPQSLSGSSSSSSTSRTRDAETASSESAEKAQRLALRERLCSISDKLKAICDKRMNGGGCTADMHSVIQHAAIKRQPHRELSTEYKTVNVRLIFANKIAAHAFVIAAALYATTSYEHEKLHEEACKALNSKKRAAEIATSEWTVQSSGKRDVFHAAVAKAASDMLESNKSFPSSLSESKTSEETREPCTIPKHPSIALFLDCEMNYLPHKYTQLSLMDFEEQHFLNVHDLDECGRLRQWIGSVAQLVTDPPKIKLNTANDRPQAKIATFNSVFALQRAVHVIVPLNVLPKIMAHPSAQHCTIILQTNSIKINGTVQRKPLYLSKYTLKTALQHIDTAASCSNVQDLCNSALAQRQTRPSNVPISKTVPATSNPPGSQRPSASKHAASAEADSRNWAQRMADTGHGQSRNTAPGLAANNTAQDIDKKIEEVKAILSNLLAERERMQAAARQAEESNTHSKTTQAFEMRTRDDTLQASKRNKGANEHAPASSPGSSDSSSLSSSTGSPISSSSSSSPLLQNPSPFTKKSNIMDLTEEEDTHLSAMMEKMAKLINKEMRQLQAELMRKQESFEHRVTGLIEKHSTKATLANNFEIASADTTEIREETMRQATSAYKRAQAEQPATDKRSFKRATIDPTSSHSLALRPSLPSDNETQASANPMELDIYNARHGDTAAVHQ